MARCGEVRRDMARSSCVLFCSPSVPPKTCAILLGKNMKDPEQVIRFIELRSEGWSVTHISRELKIPRNTLIRWNSQFKRHIEKLHAAELEALAEKLIKRREDRARALARRLQELEGELDSRSIKELSTPRLFVIVDALRRQIQRELGHIQFTATQPARSQPQPLSAATQPASEHESLDYEQAVHHEQSRAEQDRKEIEELVRYYGLPPESCERVLAKMRANNPDHFDPSFSTTPSQPTATKT